ncbi:MAG: tRNA (adenosine(37)-N6)-threonylcarbamoyltransferase complex ATPase subunit type 1 TsaE [Deltaproteobacteria bacterium]|nr:tRNA (adenosine(37)-N6)-threonylcarbamoyltransferase complex ATPase subunit type 1 TsaE [Deltaproteobacteria bacterium]
MERVVILKDEYATEQAGRLLGARARPGDVFALTGDLGAGKTRFAQALSRGLDVDDVEPVCSPTFAIIHVHSGRIEFYHVDLYRLDSEDDLVEIGLEEYLYGQGVCAVEWFDRFVGVWPDCTVEIRLDFVAGESDIRQMTVRTSHVGTVARVEAWLDLLDEGEKTPR